LFEVRINLYIEETQQKERRKKIIIKPLKTQAMAYKMTCEKLLKKVKKKYIYISFILEVAPASCSMLHLLYIFPEQNCNRRKLA
jgi:hypothetical protein